MPRILLVAGLALVGLMALAAAFTHNGGRADPALTRSNSVMPPPEHPFYTEHRRSPLYPLGLLRLGTLSGGGGR